MTEVRDVEQVRITKLQALVIVRAMQSGEDAARFCELFGVPRVVWNEDVVRVLKDNAVEHHVFPARDLDKVADFLRALAYKLDEAIEAPFKI